MISVIIPNFNGSEFLPKLLSNLKTIIHPNFEIILVDNGSTDNSLQIFQSLITRHCQLITNSSNLGFAAAVNQGINAATNPYVCLLNNDLILSPNWFNLIIDSIKKHPNVACFCGTVKNINGSTIESQGITFDWSGKCLQIKKQPAGIIWGSSAAAVVYRQDILKKIGLFDEKYFAYLEDVDLAFRLHQKHYQTLLIPNAISYHLGGGTSNKMGNFRAKQTFKNWIYFIKKNYTIKQKIVHLPSILIERLHNFSYLLKSTI